MIDRPEENDGLPGRMTHRIVVIDDDDLFRESLEQNLLDAGYAVTTFAGGPDALAALADGAGADLILLDWKMPAMNGIEVLRRLREASLDIPVIFLTVLTEQIYEEAALLGGAVDFIEKSRSFAILRKRIELIVGGSKAGGPGGDAAADAAGDTARIGLLTLYRDSHRAVWQGTEVPLTVSEFRIVDLMAGRAGRDVRYRDIYDLVRGEGFTAGQGPDGFRQNVRTFIKRIRQKFRDIDPGFEAIENYPGFGYRWRDDGE